MAWTAPTEEEFKTFFVRDFAYAPEDDPDNIEYIVDADITRAISDAQMDFNESLFGEDAQITNAFMYLAAFHLVSNLQNSAMGLNAQAKFPIQSTSAGGVSVNYQIPEKYLKNPVIAAYAQNGYGLKYLSFALPKAVGNVEMSEGTTTVG